MLHGPMANTIICPGGYYDLFIYFNDIHLLGSMHVAIPLHHANYALVASRTLDKLFLATRKRSSSEKNHLQLPIGRVGKLTLRDLYSAFPPCSSHARSSTKYPDPVSTFSDGK